MHWEKKENQIKTNSEFAKKFFIKKKCFFAALKWFNVCCLLLLISGSLITKECSNLSKKGIYLNLNKSEADLKQINLIFFVCDYRRYATKLSFQMRKLLQMADFVKKKHLLSNHWTIYIYFLQKKLQMIWRVDLLFWRKINWKRKAKHRFFQRVGKERNQNVINIGFYFIIN